MAEIVVRGARFHVQRLAPPAGGGAERGADRAGAVVFVHGLVGNMAVFYPMANHVAAAGYEAILYDLRGHGMSECTPCGYSVEDMVADLAALLETVTADRPVHLVGHSLGGTIARHLTVARPDLVASLILLDGLMGPDSPRRREDALRIWATGEKDHAANVADTVIARSSREGSRWAAKVRRLLTETTLPADLADFHSTEVETAPLISRPVLVLTGERSEFRAGADQIARLIPDCTVRVLPEYDHHTIVIAGVQAVREELIAWLDQYPGQGSARERGEPRWHASFS
jgi:pimeloyl-ACP methyl ester carboxylesterase